MAIKSVLVSAFNVSAANELNDRWQARKVVNPSPLQQNVINAVNNEKTNIIVGAVAGSGKTSLLMAVLQSLENTNNKLDVKILNIHKIGTQGLLTPAIGKIKLFEHKYNQIIGSKEGDWYHKFYEGLSAEAKKNQSKVPGYLDLRYTVLFLINIARSTLTDIYSEEAIIKLAEEYGKDIGSLSTPIPTIVAKFVSKVLVQQTEEIAFSDAPIKPVDFTDMIYMPVYVNQNKGLSHKFKFDLIVVDECQDLSRCQLELIKLCAHKNSRFLFVGDPYQAIYGFAGADTKSFNTIQKDLNCKYLPLSVNYRCPTSVIELAKLYCPQIEPCEIAINNKVEGEITHLNDEEVPEALQPGDVVLCRFNAPLIRYAIQCLKYKKLVTVKGKDLAKELVNHIKLIADLPGFDYSTGFFDYCDKYFSAKISRLKERENTDTAISMLQDYKEAIEICYSEFFIADTLESLCQQIEDLFDRKNANIFFQTIHKAKGSEAPKIYILGFNKMPVSFPKATTDQYQQERNLTYVALTRCKFEIDNEHSGKLYLGNERKN